MSDIHCFVFDLGNVLVRWNPRHACAPLFEGDRRDLDHFLNHVCNMDWHNRLDAGEPFEQAIRDLQKHHPDYADMIAAYDSHWDDMFAGSIEETVEILKELHRKQYALYALSNFPAEKFPAFREKYGFLSLFREVIISGAEGIIKPDPTLYQRLLERTGQAPGNTLFIDDRKDNVETAQALGFHAHLFQGAAGLRDRLTRLGLIEGKL